MGKRVYEIAKELDLSTKEVLGRLNEAGLEVESPLASVDDPLYERVFGNSSENDALNGSSKSLELDVLPRNLEPDRRRSRTNRVLGYIILAVLGFALAVSVGALAAMVSGGDFGFSSGEQPRPSEEQGNVQQNEEQGNVQQSEANYVSEVGRLQGESVKVFLDSHDRFVHYDALTAHDIEEMRADEATLQTFTHKIDDLNPPQKYKEQYKSFSMAVDELHKATQIAYTLVANPTAATQSGFREYDRRANRAAAYLKKSNEMLGLHYKTIEVVQEVSAA